MKQRRNCVQFFLMKNNSIINLLGFKTVLCQLLRYYAYIQVLDVKTTQNFLADRATNLGYLVDGNQIIYSFPNN